MKAIIFFVVALAFAASALGHGLEEYPSLYVSNGKVDAIVVVDDKAPASYVIAQTQIALSLNQEAGAQQQGIAKLASEVGEVNQNIISIGNPCENAVSGMLLQPEGDCAEGFEPGKAKVIVVYDNQSEFTHIVVGGYTEKGTLAAANRLKEAVKNPFGEFTIVEFGVDEQLEQEREEVDEHDITQEEERQTQEQDIEERPEPPVEEHQQGQQEAPENAEAPEIGEDTGIFQRFIAWLRNLFG
jgi:hypothetical protein